MRGLIVIIGLSLVACGGGGGGGGSGGDGATTTVTASPGAIVIGWQANRESAVNRAGGGYRVHRATTSSFDAANVTIIDVPYQSGSLAPTQTSLTFAPGTYYIKVTAYSALNPTGSAASPVTTLVVQ